MLLNINVTYLNTPCLVLIGTTSYAIAMLTMQLKCISLHPARNKSTFNPRFPAPPRNRIFHPNAFNNPAASSFLPAAFLLPTGPLFPGSQRHTSGPHIPSNMGRNNASILGLNSHHNPSHPPPLLALPVRVTPVPFILASSQALSIPSSQHLPHPTPSPPRLHPSSASSQSTPSSNATPASPSSTGVQSSVSPASPNTSVLSSSTSSASATGLVSRPTSLFQSGPQRSTPHPKHWFRFNSKHCTLLKPFPAFQHHHHQMQFRQAFNNFGNALVNKSFAPPSLSTMQPGKTFTNSLPVTNAGTSLAPSSSSTSVLSSPSSSSSSLVVTSSPMLTASLVAASKLSPHAAAFKSSIRPEDKSSEAQDSQSDSGSATLYEITPAQSRYWQRSHKACPIEVRGGTVYFSPELQKFQYKCHSSGSKKWQGGGIYSFSNASIVYFDGDGKTEDDGKKGRDKKLLSIVDPKVFDIKNLFASNEQLIDYKFTVVDDGDDDDLKEIDGNATETVQSFFYIFTLNIKCSNIFTFHIRVMIFCFIWDCKWYC